MKYEYSATNRLEHPHAYMYTAFEGTPFLRAYFASRLDAIQNLNQCDGVSSPDEKLFNIAFAKINENFIPFFSEGLGTAPFFISSDSVKDITEDDKLSLVQLAQRTAEFSTESAVVTSDLLESVIAAQVLDLSLAETKLWLDRLIQRFEVSKKLFAFYPPGFRRGEGANDVIRLYCLMALSLSLFYSKSLELKYLNTLLKVCDLLSSLPAPEAMREQPKQVLQLILAFEVAFVQALSKSKGVRVDTE